MYIHLPYDFGIICYTHLNNNNTIILLSLKSLLYYKEYQSMMNEYMGIDKD